MEENRETGKWSQGIKAIEYRLMHIPLPIQKDSTMERFSAIELVIRIDLSGTILPHTSLEKGQFHGYKFGLSIKSDLLRYSAIANITLSPIG